MNGHFSRIFRCFSDWEWRREKEDATGIVQFSLFSFPGTLSPQALFSPRIMFGEFRQSRIMPLFVVRSLPSCWAFFSLFDRIKSFYPTFTFFLLLPRSYPKQQGADKDERLGGQKAISRHFFAMQTESGIIPGLKGLCLKVISWNHRNNRSADLSVVSI